jgi:multidrug efflux pump subunit AcrB
VDDAIVVGENVFEKIEGGMPKLKAAIIGTKEMAIPITFSVLTTMVAFAPLFFVPGVMGKIFKIMPFIVITVLGVSLLESFFILPAHLSHTKAEPSGKSRFFLARIQHGISLGLDWFTHKLYRRGLEASLKIRYLVFAFAIASLIAGVGMVQGGIVPFNFFPKLEGDLVSVTARLPFGSPIERTEQVQRILESSARKTIEQNGGAQILKGMYSMLGQGPTRRRGPHAATEGAGGSHLVTIEINLVSSDLRTAGTEKLAADWQRNTPLIAGLESLVFKSSAGPGAGAPVDVQLSHTDKNVLERASNELTEQLRAFSDLTDIENGFLEGKTQLDFHLLPEARTLGLSSTDIARQLRGAFFGVEAMREQRGRNEVRVMVRFPKANRQSEFDLETLLIRTSQGGQAPLKYVAVFNRDRSPTSISREEGQRTINVTAELAHGVKSPTQVLKALRETVLPALVVRYPGLNYDMAGQQREQRDSFKALGLNFIIALFVMYALIAVPFKSYFQPLIIMSAIPFGFLGALVGHLWMGYNVSIISMFGIVALAGVVVNDSLVLIDATNLARREGKTPLEAILWAATRRLRPIMLTSLTTFFGLMPMITETSLQARFIIPMALSLGFGVLFSTIIILVLVPSLYLILEDAKRFLGKLSGRVPAPEADAQPTG